jgi:hypothetical protein
MPELAPVITTTCPESRHSEADPDRPHRERAFPDGAFTWFIRPSGAVAKAADLVFIID